MSKKSVIAIGIVITLLFGVWLFSSSPSKKNITEKGQIVTSLQDTHGLAVDRKDPAKVYIATHTGLLVMQNDGELQRVGTAQDDYMGFSAHPKDANTLYTSGHPRDGGNIGFQKSTDGGKTWQKVSNGANGPVDFHSMAVSQADPSQVYGVDHGQLQRSSDEGKAWEVVNADIGNLITLTTNTTTKDAVFAGTTNGLYVSQDRGQNWSKLGAINAAVMSLAINPTNDKEMVAYTQTQGLQRSTDGGSTWNKLGGYTGGMVMHLAYDVQNPTTVYLINQNLEVHKTTDSGATWKKVR